MPKGFFNICFALLASSLGIDNFHSIVLNDHDIYNNIMLDIDLFLKLTSHLIDMRYNLY